MSDYDLSPKYEISPRYYGHKSSKREEKIYKCKECKRTFNRRHNLTKHERVHSGDKPYVCKDCDKRFADSSNLTKHMQRIHLQNVNGIYVCKDEKGTHTLNVCELCKRSFATPDDLFQHELKYANNKAYPCDKCDKVFHLRNSWVRHSDTHNERRRYCCDMCDRTFSQKLLLEKHRQYHAPSEHDLTMGGQLDDDYNEDYNEDEDHEEDDDVEYNINNDANIKYESDVESGQRMGSIGKGITVHVCNICDKVFTYRSLWTRHLKSHSTDSSFKCHMCHQIFRRQYYLAKHRKKCRGIILDGEPGHSGHSGPMKCMNLGVTRHVV